MSRFQTIGLVVTVVVGAWLAGCDKSPTQSSPLPPPPPNQPTQPTLQSIRVEGPTSVPPGTTAKFIAIGQMSDGTSQDVTATTTWRTSDAGVLSVSPSGEATGGKDGEAVVAAENRAKRASLQVIVLTPGRYRLSGLVSDSGTPVAGATVDVLDGSRAVMSARTGADGIYHLYGLIGDVEVRVRADGYPDQVRGIPVAGDATLDFTMPTGANLTGSYELTITADAASCPVTGRNPFPDQLRVRTYAATITQSGSQLSVKLTGASLVFGSFSGTQNGTKVTFDIHGITGDPFYHYYTYFERTLDLVEQLSPPGFLIISGKATTSKDGSELSGQLAGVIGTIGSVTASYPNFTTSCWGFQKFVLSKR